MCTDVAKMVQADPLSSEVSGAMNVQFNMTHMQCLLHTPNTSMCTCIHVHMHLYIQACLHSNYARGIGKTFYFLDLSPTIVRPGIGRTVSCLMSDWSTSRPEGCGSCVFLIFSCTCVALFIAYPPAIYIRMT